MDFLKKFKAFTVFYIIIFIANLLFFTVLTDYRIVSKPFIIVSLLGFYVSASRFQSNSFILALIFALLGDIFLMFESEQFFLLGLGSFFLMQILYAITFLNDRKLEKNSYFFKIIPVLILTALAIGYLWNDLGDFKIPVTIYAFAISVMVISALIRKSTIKWYGPVVIGVFLFLISDALIALSKFGNITDGTLKYLIMATYMIAQYLIVRGMVEKNDSKFA